ncbi:MAG: hypothetical protein KIT33_15815 [Candidatus Kapabacteria bacterium]|nr:hypothetical protein [Ignavibacteriota bacterium]MCW5886438.1 hypothetical protein [Candidatus Kapabacteria bacterium]
MATKKSIKRLPLIQVPVEKNFLDDFDELREYEGKPSRVALARKIIMQHLKDALPKYRTT